MFLIQRILFYSIFLIFIGNICLAQIKYPQRGLAESIEDSQNSNKQLALHREIPTGTMIKLVNPANGKSTIVKIVGKLPDIGLNEKVIIKISQAAYKALNASGKRFSVELYPAPKDLKVKHTVEEGETLYSISKKYKVSIDDLKKWNDLKEDFLSKGQELTIIQKQ